MICLDTPVLIWGVRGFASRHQEHEIVKAQRYIEWLKRKDKRVMIPAPIIAEYLVGASATELNEGTIFELNFQIPPFDLPAAKIAANLMRDTDLLRTVQTEERVPHQCVKTDIMIIAIAMHRGAEKIVTSDSDFHVIQRLAQQKI